MRTGIHPLSLTPTGLIECRYFALCVSIYRAELPHALSQEEKQFLNEHPAAVVYDGLALEDK